MAYGKSVDELRQAEVQVPGSLRSSHRIGPHNIKDCFRKAFEYAFEHQVQGIRIVHGTHRNEYFEHAWVELPDGVLFDGVLQRFYDRERYYSITNAIKIVEYSLKAYSELMSNEGHFGPFHETKLEARAREFRERRDDSQQ